MGLTWTDEAAASLRRIYQEMARTRPQTTKRTLESLLHGIESLVTYPDLGRPYRYCGERPIRVLGYGGFQVAYRIEEDDSIIVLGVFAGSLFLPNLSSS